MEIGTMIGRSVAREKDRDADSSEGRAVDTEAGTGADSENGRQVDNGEGGEVGTKEEGEFEVVYLGDFSIVFICRTDNGDDGIIDCKKLSLCDSESLPDLITKPISARCILSANFSLLVLILCSSFLPRFSPCLFQFFF